MAAHQSCPAVAAVEPTSAVSQIGALALDFASKLSTLSEAERCELMHRLALTTPGTSEELSEDETFSETILGQALLMLFSLWVLGLFAYFGRAVVNERRRYHSRQAQRQGTFTEYLQYRFGYWYTWTEHSAAIVLMSISLALLIFGGALLRVLIQQPLSEGLWSAWLWIAAPDGGASAETAAGRLVGLIVSIGGMLVFALLMSVISEMFEEALRTFRNGTLPVIEGNHTVIIGYVTPTLRILAQELCAACESEGGILIAILSPMPKPEVEELLRDGDAGWMKNSTIVVRSGDACKVEDLSKVAVQGAKKVIIMSKPGVSREEADASTVNVLLALRNNRWPREGVSVVQCQLVRNQGLFKRLLTDGSQVVTVNDFIGELMVQCSRQSGLVHAIRSVFSFENDEFYFQHVQGTAGRTVMDLLFSLPNTILIGIKPPGCELEVLPSMDRTLKGDEELCVLAKDDSAVPRHAAPSSLDFGQIDCRRIVERSPDEPHAGQTVIILGWNNSIGAILGEIDDDVGPGSQVIIHAPEAVSMREEFIEAAQKRRKHFYQNFRVEHVQGALGARFRLEELPLETASMVLILATESYSGSASAADSQTLAAIVQVQDILAERCSPEKGSAVIMPQLLDVSIEETLIQTGIHNYVLSGRMAARLLAVISEVPQATCIIDCLTTHKVFQFSIAKLPDYPAATSLNFSEGVSFNDVTMVAALANEVVLGWSELDAGEAGPWEMNPKNRTEKRPWPENARLIVLRRTRQWKQASYRGPRSASVAHPSDERRVCRRVE
ncbi:CASTOR [Symbiodinium natans]|uniref:CASTOR protein n=1 Tax=Symbiodinium natans TaxID=878477 RepID=A0A812JDN9_9DINO|nr:CASTOR [Symbiodinium natans]